jgi:hypothetical protein
MSDLDKINDALDRIFHEEAARIVFWNDPEREFLNVLPFLLFDDVTPIRLDQAGALEVKIRLERDDPAGKYLLFRSYGQHSGPTPSVAVSSVVTSAALVEAQQVVGMIAVGLGLEVFVTEAAQGDDHVHGVAAAADVEDPFAALDAFDGVPLRKLPGRAIGVPPADADDTLVRIGAIALVDAQDFAEGRHDYPLQEKEKWLITTRPLLKQPKCQSC